MLAMSSSKLLKSWLTGFRAPAIDWAPANLAKSAVMVAAGFAVGDVVTPAAAAGATDDDDDNKDGVVDSVSSWVGGGLVLAEVMKQKPHSLWISIEHT